MMDSCPSDYEKSIMSTIFDYHDIKDINGNENPGYYYTKRR